MSWIKSIFSNLQFKDYIFLIYVIGSLFVILTFKDFFQDGNKTTGVTTGAKGNYNTKADQNWNECIFNSLEAVNPEAITSCDTKYSQIKVKGK